MWTGGTKKAVHWSAWKLAGCGRPFRCFECWRVRVMRIPKNSQIRRICISGTLFLFYAPWFFECEKIVLNFFEFFRFICKNPAPKCGIFACIFFVNASWCRWWDSNPHAIAGGGFWIRYVYQFHHTGTFLFIIQGLPAKFKRDFSKTLIRKVKNAWQKKPLP